MPIMKRKPLNLNDAQELIAANRGKTRFDLIVATEKRIEASYTQDDTHVLVSATAWGQVQELIQAVNVVVISCEGAHDGEIKSLNQLGEARKALTETLTDPTAVLK